MKQPSTSMWGVSCLNLRLKKCQSQSLKQTQTQRKWHLARPLLRGKQNRPLHLATKKGHLDVAGILLEAEADIEAMATEVVLDTIALLEV